MTKVFCTEKDKRLLHERSGVDGQSSVFTRINQVEGFNPMAYVRQLTSDIPDEPPKLYLDVAYRVLWFRLKYPHGRISKKIISFDANLAVVESRIYKDASDPPEQFLANGYGSALFDPSTAWGKNHLTTAETAAMGRALHAGGFNIANCADEADPVPVDKPVDAKSSMETSQAEHGVLTQAANEVSQEQTPNATVPLASTDILQDSSQPDAPAYTSESPVEKIMMYMSEHDAKNVVISAGFNKGKTLGELHLEKPGSLDWYTDRYRGPDNVLRAAAKILIKYGTQSAA